MMTRELAAPLLRWFEENKRDLYYNLKEQNAPMRVALKELDGTEVKITKAIIDYI